MNTTIQRRPWDKLTHEEKRMLGAINESISKECQVAINNALAKFQGQITPDLMHWLIEEIDATMFHIAYQHLTYSRRFFTDSIPQRIHAACDAMLKWHAEDTDKGLH